MHAKSLIAGLAATAAIAVPVAAQAAAPAATPLQKVSAAVEPSIVYMETTFEAAVKDPKWGFIGGEKNFSVTYSCSGFFVNPDGYFASAGHCVDYDQEVKDALLDEGRRVVLREREVEPGHHRGGGRQRGAAALAPARPPELAQRRREAHRPRRVPERQAAARPRARLPRLRRRRCLPAEAGG